MRTMLLFSFCLLALALTASHLDAQTPRGAMQVDVTNPAPGQSYDPVVVAENGNVYMAWSDTRNGCQGIYFTMSTDNGQTFSTEVRIDDDVVMCARKDLDGKVGRNIIVDGNHIYVWWYDQRNGVNNDIYFAASHDGGTTWVPNIRVDDTGAPGAIKAGQVRAAAKGNSIFFAIRLDDVNSTTNEGAYVTASSDGGVTFLPAVYVGNATPGAYDSDYIGLDNLNDTYAFVAFDDNSSGTDDIYGCRFDTSLNLDPIVRVDTDATGLGDTENAILVEADDSIAGIPAIHVIWMEERTGATSEELRYNQSVDSGLTFAAADQLLGTYVAGTDDVDNCHIAVQGTTVGIVWEDNRTGTDEIYEIVSYNDGMTWSADLWITDTSSGYAGGGGYPQIDFGARLDANGDVAAVSWSGPSAPEDAYVAWSRDNGTTFSAPINMSNSTGDVDYVELAVDGTYESCHVGYLDDTLQGLGANNVYANSFRSASITLLGDLVTGHPHKFHIENCVANESGSPAKFQCVLANSLGHFPVPGDGRDVGLPYDTLFKLSVRYGALLTGDIAVDGSGDTGTFPMQLAPGTYYSVGVVRLPAGQFGSLTDPIVFTVTP